MKTVSVIVPYYNNKRTLGRCLESILDQTYPHLEVLCVSDGSTDGSEQVVRDLARMDSRIVPLSIPHGGVSAARNEGIRQASGAFLQFADADDYLEPQMVEKLMAALTCYDADIAACGFFHPFLENTAGNAVYDLTDVDALYTYYQHTFAGHVPWNKLYRREAVTAPFPEGIDFAEDGMFGVANMCGAKKAVTLKEKLYHYCVAPADTPSLIGSMAQGAFWETEDTFWYKRKDLAPLAEKVFKAHLPKARVAEFSAVRLFDFLLWETVIFVAAGAPKAGIVKEFERVLTHPAFIEAMEAKKRFGIALRPLSENEQHTRVEQFVDGYTAFWSAPNGRRPFDVCLQLFATLFLEKVGEIDPLDFVAAAYMEIDNKNTP